MADYLSDVYQIPVEFVDGQQPTAAFLNAWASQIDTAFLLMSRVLGDFDGDGEADDTYLSNIIRAIGVAGLINNRLPRDLKVTTGLGAGASEDLPRVIEDVGASFEDEKEAELSFFPSGTEATDTADGVIDAGNLGTGVAKGSPVKTSVLSVADRWILDGRRILTSTPIPSNATLAYAIDTDSDLYKDAYGAGTGPNVVPSLYEIAKAPEPGEEIAELCTISQPAGYDEDLEFKISFPNIRRIQNPSYPQTVAAGDVIKLDDDDSPVRWLGLIPKWRIPAWIYTLASLPANNGVIPAGLVGLWYHNGTTASRVRPTSSSDDIKFEIVADDKSAIKITLPVGFALPVDGSPGEDNESRYILGFAGTSVSEALIHERARMAHHKHDGKGDDSLIDTQYLLGRFNPAKWSHSVLSHNHFPQYLERSGYQAGDLLNGRNAMLGTLLMGSQAATPGDTADVQGLDDDSYTIYFGSTATGPALGWTPLDTLGNASDVDGKFSLFNKSMRILKRLYIGDITRSSYLGTASFLGDERLQHLSSWDFGGGADATKTIFETGKLILRGGQIQFVNTVDSIVGDLTLEADGDDTALNFTTSGGKAIIGASQFNVNLENGDTFVHSIPLTTMQILKGSWKSGFADPQDPDIDYTIAYPFPEGSIGGNARFEALVTVPQPEAAGIDINVPIGLDSITVYVTARSNDGITGLASPGSGRLRVIQVSNTMSNTEGIGEFLVDDTGPPAFDGDNTTFERLPWVCDDLGFSSFLGTGNGDYVLSIVINNGDSNTKFGVSGIVVTYKAIII